MARRLGIGLALALGIGAAIFHAVFPAPRFEKPDHSIEAEWIIFRTWSTVTCLGELEIWPAADPSRKETFKTTHHPERFHAATVHWLQPDTEYDFRIRLIAGPRETVSPVARVRTKPKVEIRDVAVQPDATQAVVTFRTTLATIGLATCRIIPDYEHDVRASDVRKVEDHRLVLGPLRPDTEYVLELHTKHHVPEIVDDMELGIKFRTKPAR